MSLFQKSVEKKYLNELDSVLIDKKYKEFQDYFGNPSIQENIRNSKEEQFQEGFLRELFVSIFGYTLNPQPNFNLTTELKNIVNSKKADGAILKGEDAIAVIELKGTDTTDLDKIETQAFGYKNHHPKCVYVITSNFEKLRFYIQNAVDHIDFDLFNLTREQFSLMWLCLAKDNLLNGLPQKIKESSLLQEENITKKLYADYSKFREAIYNNLVKNNPETDKLLLFKKTQKLLDRFLFIFFAEDRLLLPPNSISEIVKQWTTLKDELDEYVPLYDRFKKYFGYMNTGYKGKKYDIFAYNGGLFAPDEILDNISIDDEILHKHTLTLSQYDFETDVDVNILGHIFEHSLGEIENVQAEIKGEKIDTQKTKRKKDGIFYTPKYITKYIVENTVGKLCEEKRTELDIVDEEYAKGRKNRKKDTIKTLDDKLTDYRNWLLSLTILDPACGSGAFLNQALDFLITEHRKIDDLRAQLFGNGLVFSDITTDILEKNIYGVDLNEESVEIAKLSLWLRTAQKGRKLNKLNENIKCGNSLVTEKFDWKTQFPEIIKNGGFDVIIGNPPYVKEATNKNAFNGLHDDKCYQGKMDLWYFFGSLAIDIVKKENGLIGYIAPNNWITNDGASKFRDIILQNGKLIEFIDFGDFKVFDTAGIQTMIYIMKNTVDNSSYSLNYSKIIDKKITHEDAKLFLEKIEDNRFEYFESEITKKQNLGKTISFINSNLNILIDKIERKKNFFLNSDEIASGIDLLQDFVNKKHKEVLENVEIGDGIFNLSQIEYQNLNLSQAEKELIKPFYTTKELHRFYGEKQNNHWIIYTNSEFKNEEKIIPYPNIKKHLDKFIPVLTSVNKPYGLHRAREEKYFKGEKIFSLRKCSKRPTFTYTDFDAYVNRTFLIIKTDRINQKFLAALLNSDIIAFWLKFKGKLQGDNFQIDKNPLLGLPLIKPNEATESNVTDLVKIIIENNQKIVDYSSLLDKAKKENNFDREIKLEKELNLLKEEIVSCESKINYMINHLYGLTDKEIKIVEESI
jgi:type I restriction-modification system DNA methylase subunit